MRMELTGARSRFYLAGYALFLLAAPSFLTHAHAQPPNISRWSGSTALTPPQGYTQGSPLTLTWGFANLGTPITNDGFPVAGNNLQTRLNQIYGNQSVWQPVFQAMFNRWSSLSGLTYQFEANDDGTTINNTVVPGQLNVRADLRIAGKPLDGDFGVLAYNYFPNHGDMVIDTNDSFFTNVSNNSLNLRQTTAHEHGHGLGMDHVDSNNAKILLQPFLDTSYDGPQHHDILVAHRGYGDVLEKTNGQLGNDVFNRATSLGSVTSSSAATIGNSARTLAVAPTATDFVSIDSSTDTDFFSFSVAGSGQVNLLLEALGFTYNATPEGAGGNIAFNSKTRVDLALALFDTNGTTLLASANATGLGGNESLSFLLPGAGTYFARVTGTNNPDASLLDTQFYGLTIGLTAVPEPATWALLIGGTVASGIGYRRWRRRNKRALETEVEPVVEE